jgi:hypothetical protein
MFNSSTKIQNILYIFLITCVCCTSEKICAAAAAVAPEASSYSEYQVPELHEAIVNEIFEQWLARDPGITFDGLKQFYRTQAGTYAVPAPVLRDVLRQLREFRRGSIILFNTTDSLLEVRIGIDPVWANAAIPQSNVLVPMPVATVSIESIKIQAHGIVRIPWDPALGEASFIILGDPRREEWYWVRGEDVIIPGAVVYIGAKSKITGIHNPQLPLR